MINTAGETARSGKGRLSAMKNPWLASFALVLPTLLLFGFCYFYPILQLLPKSIMEDGSITFEYFEKLLFGGLYTKTLVRTILICVASTVINLLLGYPVAYWMATSDKKTSERIYIIVILSLWTSLLVRTYAWMAILQRQGVINDLLIALHITEEPIQMMYTSGAVLVGMVNLLLPYMIISIHSVLASLDPSIRLAALSLGASKRQAFFTVTLPLSVPGMASGVLLVFIQSLGFYVTPLLLGGAACMMMSGLIDKQMFTMLNWSFGAAIGVVILLITVIFLLVFNKLFGMDALQRKLG